MRSTALADPPQPMPASGGLGRHVCAALVLAGLVTLVAGTFLPWLRSGQTLRNSYAAAGALRELLDAGGPIGGLISAWPFVNLACAAPIALYALGLHRTAALIAALAAACTASVSIAALSVSGSHFAAPTTSGPLITLIGSAIVGCAIMMRLGIAVRDLRSAP